MPKMGRDCETQEDRRVKLKSQAGSDYCILSEKPSGSLCFLNIQELLSQTFEGPPRCSPDLIIALSAWIRKAHTGIPPPQKPSKAQETRE